MKKIKTIVVTGAGGFIGRALVKKLVELSYQVVAIVHTLDNTENAVEGARYIECSQDNYSSIIETLSEFSPDVFFHFAWMGTSGMLRSDEKSQLANVQGTCEAVKLASSAGCKRFVFASSIMGYEVDSEIKRMENPNVNSIYSVAKLTADYMARIISNHLQIEYISALISNIYGPGEKSQRLINYSIRKLLAGENLSLSTCEQLYDFIYISDAVRFFIAIAENGTPGRTYYIGNRKVYPLKKFMIELRDIVAPNAKLGFGEMPLNGAKLTYDEFDKDILFNDMGIETEISFSEGIKRTRDWIREEINSEQF